MSKLQGVSISEILFIEMWLHCSSCFGVSSMNPKPYGGRLSMNNMGICRLQPSQISTPLHKEVLGRTYVVWFSTNQQQKNSDESSFGWRQIINKSSYGLDVHPMARTFDLDVRTMGWTSRPDVWAMGRMYRLDVQAMRRTYRPDVRPSS